MDNTHPPLVWPRLLDPPPAHVLLVYLDLNHWIGLAKASVGHPNGQAFVAVLNTCRTARSQGTAVFVLSGTIYAEMLKIPDPEQRLHLARVMEELTGFATLISRVTVMECELSAMLDPAAKRPSPLNRVPLVGRGVRHAFGLNGGIAILDESGRDVSEELRAEIGEAEFDRKMEEIFVESERAMLRGPADSKEDEALRALGYFPEGPRGVVEDRAAQERAFKAILDADSHWRRGRLSDLVSARELEIEFQNILPRALEERGLALGEVITGPESGRAFVATMPSTEVSITLKTAWHRNGQRNWTVNDIDDIDAMALAVPYCDVVVTEKACSHILRVAGLPERMGTAVLNKLTDLPDVLCQHKPKQRVTGN